MTTTRERIARIEKEVMGGWARRGVTSWEQDWLIDWRNRTEPLGIVESEKLAAIERRVFGPIYWQRKGEA